MYAALRAKGYSGSYGPVAAFAPDWRRGEQERLRTAGRGTFVPLSFAPGEAFQFDWSEDAAVIGGERVKLQIAQFMLCHSRAFLLRAYPLQTHEMLFDAHAHAFAVFDGASRYHASASSDRIGARPAGGHRRQGVRFGGAGAIHCAHRRARGDPAALQSPDAAPLDAHRYRARHLIESLFARLKQFRDLATRYDKLAQHFAAFVMLASICVWMA